ncbi:MAG: phosphatase PAP2 family protein [Mycobacteriales bacterium]
MARPVHLLLPGAGAAAVLLAVTVLVAARWSPLIRLDHRIAADVQPWALRHRGYRIAMRELTDALAPWPWRGLALVVAAVLLVRRRLRPAAMVAGVAVIAGVGGVLAKWLVDRPRPRFAHPVAHVPGSSFPSGHAVNAAAIGGALLVLVLATRWRALISGVLVAVMLVTGWTRIALGAHYLSDVVGGLLLGGLIAAAGYAAATWGCRPVPQPRRRTSASRPATGETSCDVTRIDPLPCARSGRCRRRGKVRRQRRLAR